LTELSKKENEHWRRRKEPFFSNSR
jgi:hypothetical protein